MMLRRNLKRKKFTVGEITNRFVSFLSFSSFLFSIRSVLSSDPSPFFRVFVCTIFCDPHGGALKHLGNFVLLVVLLCRLSSSSKKGPFSLLSLSLLSFMLLLGGADLGHETESGDWKVGVLLILSFLLLGSLGGWRRQAKTKRTVLGETKTA